MSIEQTILHRGIATIPLLRLSHEKVSTPFTYTHMHKRGYISQGSLYQYILLCRDSSVCTRKNQKNHHTKQWKKTSKYKLPAWAWLSVMICPHRPSPSPPPCTGCFREVSLAVVPRTPTLHLQNGKFSQIKYQYLYYLSYKSNICKYAQSTIGANKIPLVFHTRTCPIYHFSSGAYI